MYVLEIHPWEEPGSAPSRTTQGLTNVIQAALRKSGSEARLSPSTASSVWSNAWRSIDLTTPEMFCSWSTQVKHCGQEFEVLLHPCKSSGCSFFSENTPGFLSQRDDANRWVERLSDEEREEKRRRINTDRTVIEKKIIKRQRFQLIVQAWGWTTILSFRCLFLRAPPPPFFLLSIVTADMPALFSSSQVRKCRETTTAVLEIAYSRLTAGHHSSSRWFVSLFMQVFLCMKAWRGRFLEHSKLEQPC